VTGYEVRFSSDGPPTLEDWDTLPDPGDLPARPGSVPHSATWALADLGLTRDTDVWFALRTRDDRDLRSRPSEAVLALIPGIWWVEGSVTDPVGTPLEGIAIRDMQNRWTVTTDTDGLYRLGPYSQLTSMVVEAATPVDAPPGASWYTALSDTLRPEGPRRQDFRLIARAGIAEECFLYEGRFLNYFLVITGTGHPTDGRPNQRLFRWESLPLAVHVPAWVSPVGIDFGHACRTALDIWNRNSGMTIFQSVEDPGEADIRFEYGLDPDLGVIGRAVMLQPGDGRLFLGEAAPEEVVLELADYFPIEQKLQETALHELGHALGLYGHSYCYDSGHLMYKTSNGALDDGPDNAIHEDEIRALRLIYDLPQGWDMAPYPLNQP